MIKAWRDSNFQTFNEWTIKIKINDKSYFFFVLEDKEDGKMTYWGQDINDSPTIPNLYKLVAKETAQDAIDKVIVEFPEAKNQTLKHAGTRVFPLNRIRYNIEMRQPLKLVRYIVLKGLSGGIFVKESQIIEEYEE